MGDVDDDTLDRHGGNASDGFLEMAFVGLARGFDATGRSIQKL
ncbi:hypothetical protein [Xanthomonas campestris]|jgi:hypothetical protein|nr:hypothetical protein [Xanthomonas campestris]MDM7595500.1 hypothetical protein [Xanthomonas campestris pv. campestris]MDM7604313.1 hypothetical protein [Xanthomonas campestris pv. campestris]MDM7617700.1 hypothetical protein [Xanthomonas campestris pv. campestris]MDM7621708.1 hypothetical protein [Xanthomonas campestris pv. campestris]MDM7625856.1 hypothetical protein [Xanthomonas campestris pv. campestris]